MADRPDLIAYHVPQEDGSTTIYNVRRGQQDRPDLDALADRAAGDSPEELTEADCQRIARILRVVATAPGPLRELADLLESDPDTERAAPWLRALADAVGEPVSDADD